MHSSNQATRGIQMKTRFFFNKEDTEGIKHQNRVGVICTKETNCIQICRIIAGKVGLGGSNIKFVKFIVLLLTKQHS